MPRYESSKLREERASLVTKMDAVLALANTEERDLIDEERSDFDALETKIEQLDADIRRAEKLEGYKAQATRSAEIVVDDAEVETRASVKSEALTYRRDNTVDASFFTDMVEAREGSVTAAQRLNRHREELAEQRALSTTTGQGGEFAPPLWMQEEWIKVARAGRPFADACTKLPLPPRVGSINFPKVSTGATVASQTDNASVSNTDATTGSVTVPIETIAGNADVSRQVLDRSVPGIDQVLFDDLLRAYATQLDVQCLNGSGSSGQATGVLNTSGINTVTYTDGSPTVAKVLPNIFQAVAQVEENRFLAPSAIFMTPGRWNWILAGQDANSRPFVLPREYGPFNAAGVLENVAAEKFVGTLGSLPVISDASIPQTLGAGTNQDVIIVARVEDLYLFENDVPQMKVYEEVLSGTLGVRIQVYNYFGFTAARYPKSVSVIQGTGLVKQY